MDKAILFLDTEFNGSKFDGYGGELLSMGIVSGSDSGIEHRFYQAIKYSDNDDGPWDIPSFEARVERVEYLVKYAIRHNALYDAIALKKTLLKMHNYTLF